MHEQLKQIGNLKRKMRGLSLRGFIHHLVTDRTLEQVRHNTFIGPDFFVALDVSRGECKSWVIWEQGKGPDVVVKLLSASTVCHDKTHKKTLYARQMHVPECYWYNPFNPEDFAGFTLHDNDYRQLVADSQGRLHSPALNLDLGRWTGTFRGVVTVWLRGFTPEGAMLPTEAEAEAAHQQAEVAQAERLTERLRQLGVDPDSL